MGRVTVLDRGGEEVELRDDDRERAVRESFDFLLERESADGELMRAGRWLVWRERRRGSQ